MKPLHQLLKVDYNAPGIWLQEQSSLQKLVGILGMALPALLYIFVYVDSGYHTPLESISHYYYTRVGSILVIVVSLLAIFLIIYKGKAPADFYLSTVAGLGALLLLLFPTYNITSCCDATKEYSVTHLHASSFREGFHLFSAAVFLVCLAFMSFFVFTKTSPNGTTDRKRTRNFIYRACAIVMVAALLIIAWGFLSNSTSYNENHLTFWMETVAVESFGISWLIKGETFFKDIVTT